MSVAPGKPIPAACGDWAAAKAAYRFFDNRFSPAISPRPRRALRRAKVRSSSCRTRPNLSTAARSRAKSASPKPSTPCATRPASPTC
ncbi:transposase DNA-binding-containing protein [Mesorhizobium sp. M1216]|uniref:IS4/Tn5 family transposase DNA-binding protein n=1 Tax=Mesorhizobium sp. M1216 TaxID=2957069 RepID=UPI003339C4D3